jgi:SdpC family antimicrobial peptide
LFPDIWDARALKSLESPDAARTLKAIDGLVSIIRERDASFFDRFATEIRSGDHLRVERAMDEAAQRLLDAVASTPEGRAALADYADHMGVLVKVHAVAYVWYIAAAVHQHVAAVHAVVATVAVLVKAAAWFWGPREAEASQLQRDFWVNEITKRLRRST